MKKKIFITESQFNYIIAEESGYVNAVKQLTNYIYTKLIQKTALEFGKGIANKILNLIKLGKYKFKRDLSFNIDKNQLVKLGVNFIENLQVTIDYKTKSDGGFYPTSLEFDNGKILNGEIMFGTMMIIESYFKDKPYLYSTIQHEVTHLYEYCMRYLNNSGEYKNFRNKRQGSYFSDYSEKEYIESLLYYTDSLEINATISELYTFLEKSKANKTNYKQIYQKSTAYHRIFFLEKLINYMKNDINIISYIQTKVAPTYTRKVLPNPNNKTPEQYQEKLINYFSKIVSDYQKRINKLIGTYLLKQ